MFSPMLALAQERLGNVTDLVESIGNIVQIAIPIVAALALLYFFWGLANFILATGSGDEDKRDKAKSVMIWGIVALFLIVSVWGIVEFIGDALVIDQDTGNQQIPGVERP